MGAFFIARNDGLSLAADRLDKAHQALGFARARRLDLGAYTLYLYRKLTGAGGLIIEPTSGSFACLTGQLLYCGETGEAALRRYCADLGRGKVEAERMIGQFALLICDEKGLRIAADPMGFYQVYYDTSGRAVSSSFWALLELLPDIAPEPAGIYEYAWNGACFGGKTFIREIRRLPADQEIVIGQRLAFETPERPRESPQREAGFEAAVEEHSGRLRRLFAELAAAYGERLSVSFSGGFDSRLMLAGLLAAGLRPRLFVYGSAGGLDVEIARQVSVGEDLSLRAIDKSALVDLGAAASVVRQEQDFAHFDSWKVDGIFDDGVDAEDRLTRHEHDGVPLNGSLGEIYRNFFYIPDRRMSLRSVAESFFSTFAPAACTDRFDTERYFVSLTQAFQKELGSEKTVISRAQVESLYPLVRGRYWTGRDVALNLRFGEMHFPFMQAQLIRGTAEIPISFKNHGLFEAKLIERLSPRLARYPSDYGYRFSEPPPLKHRAKSWFTLLRPPWLRRFSYRLRFARRHPFPNYLSPPHLAAMMDAEMPYLRRYFHIKRLNDPDAFNRVATMEYILQRYSARG